MAGTLKRYGPAFIAASATNIYTPEASTIRFDMRHIHIDNVTAGAITFSMYIGATGGSAAGTEIFKDQSIAAKSPFDFFCSYKMLSTDFLSAIASAGSSLVIVVSGELVVV
jgi:hypothetical protein